MTISTVRRLTLLTLFNVVSIAALFFLAEIGFRIYHDGFARAFGNLTGPPYSNLGTSNWVIYDAELGYRLNPSRPGVNKLSVRGPEIAIPKPKGTYRILFLGDSIPYDHDGFVKRFTQHIGVDPRYEVINASVPGYTTYQEVAFFKRYLRETSPDLLIWVYCLNDNHKFLHQFDERGTMLVTDEATESLKIHNFWDHIASRSYLLSALKLRLIAARIDPPTKFPWEQRVDFNVAWKDYTWPTYEGYLKEMRDLLASLGTTLVLVYFPYEPQLDFRNDEVNYDYATKPQRILGGLCKKYDIQCLNAYAPFARSYNQNKPLYRDKIHLNEDGQILAESLIYNFLTKNKLLKQP